MTAINKWNGKLYNVFSMQAGTVKLQRSDGSEFEIQKAEFYFNYRVIEKEEVKDEPGNN